MAYDSVDALQRALADDVFHYAKDAKKAAGRALGTLVEIITFYVLKSWGLEYNTAIERHVPEYGNPGITHNVEFTLHPSSGVGELTLPCDSLPITGRKLVSGIAEPSWPPSKTETKAIELLSSNRLLRNACTLFETEEGIAVAYLACAATKSYRVVVRMLTPHPFAMLECKRVGVEEGVKKGPQTIEKAKQGAYVARSVSALQKIRMSDGSVRGILEMKDGSIRHGHYEQLLETTIASNDAGLVMIHAQRAWL